MLSEEEKMKRRIILLLTALITLAFASCGESISEEDILGTWNCTVQFYEDGNWHDMDTSGYDMPYIISYTFIGEDAPDFIHKEVTLTGYKRIIFTLSSGELYKSGYWKLKSFNTVINTNGFDGIAIKGSDYKLKNGQLIYETELRENGLKYRYVLVRTEEPAE